MDSLITNLSKHYKLKKRKKLKILLMNLKELQLNCLNLYDMNKLISWIKYKWVKYKRKSFLDL